MPAPIQVDGHFITLQFIAVNLASYQNECKKHGYNTIRIIKNNNLYLIEEALRILLFNNADPSSGYRLAVSYCEHYDSAYGTKLDDKSIILIHGIVRFMFAYERLSEFEETE
jgi:hypothetical protein